MNPTAQWSNQIVNRVAETASHVLFSASGGGYVYRCTKEEWNKGTIEVVEG